MTRIALPQAVVAQRVIAVARKIPADRIEDVVDVLAGSGVGVVEVTLDAHDALDAIARAVGRGVTVGAGTVRSATQAVQAIDGGAGFIVSPHTDPLILESALERGVPALPGALTPTEVSIAWDLGASAVKLFPAMVGGPAYLKTLRGPLAHVDFVPTGGIDAANADAYLEAGAIAVGVGGWLTGVEDLNEMSRRASQLTTAVAP
ncbi:MAG: bifunctional 4-hydroxy-2-oxoglutarate aldolase/2-dehydro-3-deoxy-phosphogluconate aldolase [Acidimicrobiia bacterium]